MAHAAAAARAVRHSSICCAVLLFCSPLAVMAAELSPSPPLEGHCSPEAAQPVARPCGFEWEASTVGGPCEGPVLSLLHPAASAIAATVLISVAPLAVLPFMPSVGSAAYAKTQPLLLCFAAGGMLGDVFLHILPETLGHAHGHGDGHHPHAHADHEHEHDHDHSDAHAHDHGHGHAHAHDHGHGEAHAHSHEAEGKTHSHDHHEAEGHSHSMADAAGGLAVLAGFLTFFIVEKLVRHHGHHGHAHTHAHGQASDTSNAEAAKESDAASETGAPASAGGPRASCSPAAPSRKPVDSEPAPAAARPPSRKGKASSETAASAPDADTSVKKSEASGDGDGTKAKSVGDSAAAAPPAASASDDVAADRKVSGYLNLAADAAHNFTDGLMIGAAFRTSWEAGYSTTLAVLFHEVPHEVGDVAILMQAGFGKWRSIRAQLCTAVAALIGTCIALSTGQAQAATLLNFTAGGFVYVATVDVVPELLRDGGVRQTLQQVAAMCAGIGMMVLVLILEGSG